MHPSISNVDISQEMKGDVLVFKIKGRLDALSTPFVEKHIFNSIQNQHYKLLLDFSGVEYISSAGMRMLLSTSKKLHGLSGKIMMCCVHPNVLDIFKLAGFDRVLEMTNTEEEALRRF